jgi:hypothetical protein
MSVIVELDEHRQFVIFWALELPVRIAATLTTYLFGLYGQVRLWALVPISLGICTWYILRHIQGPLRGWWGSPPWYHWLRLIHVPLFFTIAVLAAMMSTLTWWVVAADTAITALWALWHSLYLIFFRGQPLLFFLVPCFNCVRGLVFAEDSDDEEESRKDPLKQNCSSCASCAAPLFSETVSIPGISKLGLRLSNDFRQT